MKKTIHKNYSLLVLVLLILYMTYINLPPDKINNMTGGAIIDPNNPYLGMDDDELNKHLIEHSTIYLYLSKYSWVYWTIVVILLGVAGYFAYTQFTIQGIPALGVNPGVKWDDEGKQFLNYFYLMSKQNYGLLASEYSPNINSEVLGKKFEEEFDKFVLKDDGKCRTAIDTFCNAVAPCNICNCSGPDPNYAGVFENAPKILYGGNDTYTGDSCVPKNTTNKPSPADAANAIIKMQESRGISDLVFGRIPNCCCHLWKALIPNRNDFTATGLQTLVNTLSRITEIPMSTTTGCQPSKPGNSTPLKDSNNKEIIPFRDESGKNTYVYEMVKGCIDKNKIDDLKDFKIDSTNNRVTNVTDAFINCRDYDVDLDEGVSPAHVAKNARKYVKQLGTSAPGSSLRSAPSLSAPPKSLTDVSSSWTSGLWNENGGNPPKLNIVKPTNWPTVVPFTQKGIINSYWYKSSSGIIYQLNINNRLYEIGALPVKKRNIEIYINEITDSNLKTFLDSYLSTAALAANPDIFIYGGAYYFP